MIIQSIRLNLYDPEALGVIWNISGSSGDYWFFIERSESADGPWITLNNLGLTNVYGFIDRTINREAFDRHLYYRIRTINKLTNEIEVSQHASTIAESGTYIGKYIARQESLLLRRFTGTKCAVYIRRTFGERCINCYDPIRGKCIFDNCLQCYGTTFKGGYFSPILMYINFNPRVKTQDRSNLQRLENAQETAWTSNYPMLEYDDLVVDVESSNERFLIKTSQTTENRNATVKQSLGLMKLHMSAPQFQVPVLPDIKSIDDVNVFRTEWV